MQLVSFDEGATYVRITEEQPVTRTVSVSDLVMVDLNEHGEPIGVDFAVPPRMITESMLERLVVRFPTFKPLLASRDWTLASV